MYRAKTFVATTLLVFAFSLTSYAGDQQTPGYVQPPPSSMTASSATVTDENTNNSTTAAPTTDVDTSDSFWFEAVTTLLSVY
ncbi:MAG: hypothetical protein C5B55_14690 [Blastocatellia bacterium]|nr:MAG: hypothetical protein C5B55_14690 [Blastocatellia bacterium]